MDFNIMIDDTLAVDTASIQSYNIDSSNAFLVKVSDKYYQRIFSITSKFTEDVLSIKELRPTIRKTVLLKNELETKFILDVYDVSLCTKKQEAFGRLHELKEEIVQLHAKIPPLLIEQLSNRRSIQMLQFLLNYIDLLLNVIQGNASDLVAKVQDNANGLIAKDGSQTGIDDLIFYIAAKPSVERLQLPASREACPDPWICTLESLYAGIDRFHLKDDWSVMENALSLPIGVSEEIETQHAILEKLKQARQQAKLNCLENKALQLQIVQIKVKIAYLQGNRFEKIGKGANGAVLVKWKNKRIAVLKFAEGATLHHKAVDQLEASGNYSFSGLTQWIGFYTKTSQKAVICGSGSKNIEACAEKAGFMLAEKFHEELIKSAAMARDAFTPMIAGAIDFPEGHAITTASLAVFLENAIDADIAHQLACILNKNLTAEERDRFQIFTIIDFLMGHTDRHPGNWMVELSYKQPMAEEDVNESESLKNWQTASLSGVSSFCKFPNQVVNIAKVKNKTHLKELQEALHLTPDDYVIDKIIPIDNGNILPTVELGYTILDSKQYDWKNLPFATLPFSKSIGEFIAHFPLNEAWVDAICQKINADPHIKSMSSDIGGIFIKNESIVQMKLRAKKLKEIGTGRIETPRQLAEEPLTGKNPSS